MLAEDFRLGVTFSEDVFAIRRRMRSWLRGCRLGVIFPEGLVAIGGRGRRWLRGFWLGVVFPGDLVAIVECGSNDIFLPSPYYFLPL